MTVNELRELLAGLPGDAPVLVPWTEAGYDECGAALREVVTLDAPDKWTGRYDVASVSDLAKGRPTFVALVIE